jgi:hypothetical protein
MGVDGGVVKVGLGTVGCALPGLTVHANVRTPTIVNRSTLVVVCGWFNVPVPSLR